MSQKPAWLNRSIILAIGVALIAAGYFTPVYQVVERTIGVERTKELFAWVISEKEGQEKSEAGGPESQEPEREESVSIDFPDEIDLATVIFIHHDIRAWPASFGLEVRVSGSAIDMRQRLTSELRAVNANVGDLVAGNAWVIAQIDGQWYAATWEWFKQGQTSKRRAALAGDHIKKSPFPVSWRPARGEVIYIAVSALARNAIRNGQVRTPFVRVVVP